MPNIIEFEQLFSTTNKKDVRNLALFIKHSFDIRNHNIGWVVVIMYIEMLS